jgi:hypothetical protein
VAGALTWQHCNWFCKSSSWGLRSLPSEFKGGFPQVSLASSSGSPSATSENVVLVLFDSEHTYFYFSPLQNNRILRPLGHEKNRPANWINPPTPPRVFPRISKTRQPPTRLHRLPVGIGARSLSFRPQMNCPSSRLLAVAYFLTSLMCHYWLAKMQRLRLLSVFPR